MGWLQKAVSYLKSAQKTQQEELSLFQLKEWLQQRSKEIIEQHNLHSVVTAHAKLFEDKRWALEAQIDVWARKARLHPKANQIIPLFRETRQILDLLHFSPQPSIGEVLAVNQEIEERLHVLIEKIEGGDFSHDYSFILEEDAHSDTNPLLAVLLDLDAHRKRLDLKIGESKYHAIQVIDSKAEQVRRMSVHLQQLNQELSSKKDRLVVTQQKKEEKERFLQQLRGDKKNLDLHDLTKRKKELEEKLEEKEMEVLSFFSKIKPLLHQYKEIEPSNGLLFSYLKDPLSSFFQDEGLFVADILANIASLLREGKFHLSQEVMVSSLSALEGVYNQRLKAVKAEYKELQRELKEVSDQIHHNFFVIKVDDAAYRLDHYLKQAQKLEEEIAALAEKSNRLQEVCKREQQELHSLIKSSLDKDVVISIQ